MLAGQVPDNTGIIDVSSLSNGIYYIQINTADNKSINKLVISE